jgi:hypothetical protein
MEIYLPKVITPTSVLHLEFKRPFEVMLHDPEHLFPRFAKLGIAGQIEIKEPMASTSVE